MGREEKRREEEFVAQAIYHIRTLCIDRCESTWQGGNLGLPRMKAFFLIDKSIMSARMVCSSVKRVKREWDGCRGSTTLCARCPDSILHEFPIGVGRAWPFPNRRFLLITPYYCHTP